MTDAEINALKSELYSATNGIGEDYWKVDEAGQRIQLYGRGGYWLFSAKSFEACAIALRKAFKQPEPTPAGTWTPVAIMLALKEAAVCLDRYTGPGTRGHEAKKRCWEILKAHGITEEPSTIPNT